MSTVGGSSFLKHQGAVAGLVHVGGFVAEAVYEVIESLTGELPQGKSARPHKVVVVVS
jgi:hypothetical protein